MPSEQTTLRQWPADEVTRCPTESILPYPRNPRTHSPEQIKLLAQSIEAYGFTTPLLVDENNVLIYGHGRLAAAQLLALDEVPVAVARGWTEAEKSAYRIADNQLGLLSGWDKPMLKAELKDLSIDGSLSLDTLGFPELQLDRLLPKLDVSEPEQEITDEQKPLMIEAWQALVAEWLTILEKQQLLSTNFTKAALAVHFLRARFLGIKIPSAATLAYNPHRVLVIGDGSHNTETSTQPGGSIVDGLRHALTNNGNMIERLWFVLAGQPRLDKLLSGTLPFRSCRLPADFPSDLARQLYDEFSPEGGRVLDPCHGWGGRMLGFLLSEKTEFYGGFDPDVATAAGVHAMFSDLAQYTARPKAIRLESIPYEDAKLPEEHFDFALTSPPYFDTERYGGEQSSWKRYARFDLWVEGFYMPLIEKTARALKPNGVFALQVGSQQYPLAETARALANNCGLEHAETRLTEMSEHGYVGLGTDGAAPRNREEHEVIVVLKKKAAHPKVRRSKKVR